MISYNGWERDYQENKKKYIEIFDKAMSQDSEDISFLEKKIADISNRKYAVGVNNATDLEYIATRHPAGARAGAPLTAYINAVAKF